MDGTLRFTELVGQPEHGRVFSQTMRPGLADCAPSGRMRLDAIARWLQDVAYADVEDAGLAHSAVWVLRRTRLCVSRFPRFAESFTVRTFCSGLGPMWAERRTTIRPAQGDGNGVETVALWVHLDPVSWRPAPFSEAELEAYGDTGSARRVSARLRHPSAQPSGATGRWIFRTTERDIAGHVNNAAYWQPIEDEILAGEQEPRRLDAEIEFRTPCQPGEKLVLSEGDRRWLLSPAGDTHASFILAAHGAADGDGAGACGGAER